MKKIIISVVIPIYNGVEYIKKMISALNAQTYINFEVIFVNDGSTDGTLELLKNVDKHFLSRIINQSNQGVSAARNCGLKNANGEYICFIDIDDDISSDFLSIHYSACNMFQSNISLSPYTTHRQGLLGNGSNRIIKKSKDEILYDFLYKRTRYALPSTLISRDLFLKNNLLFPVGYKYSEDVFILWQLLALEDYVSVIMRPLYCYNQNQNSAMHKSVDINRQDAIDLMKKLESIMLNLAPEFYDEFCRYAVAKHYWSILWQAARYYHSYNSFIAFCSHFPMNTEMKKLRQYPDKRIAFTALLYRVSPHMYFMLLHLLMKARWILLKR